MLNVIKKTARHLGEMRFVPDAQRVGNDHPPLRAVFCQTDARISRLQRGHSVLEGNSDIGDRYDIELRTIAFCSALPQFQSRATAALADGVCGIYCLGIPV